MQQKSVETSEIELEELPPTKTLAKPSGSYSPRMGDLIANGIPVASAVFHQAVNDSKNMPQSFFSEKSDKKDRHAKMWWTSGGLVVLHGDLHIIVPSANVIYAHVKKV